MEGKFSKLVTSSLEYRVRQLVPAIILIFPSLWIYNGRNIEIEGINNQWLFAIVLVSIAVAGSFITETIAEYIEHKYHWRYWKDHPQFLRTNRDNEEINLADEWYRYLKRNAEEQLIADKYINSFVDRMRLRCALIVPFLWNGLYFGKTMITDNCTIQADLAISITCFALSYFFFVISREDVKVLINTRKSTINGNN